jgi:hypothetical protein
LVLLAGQKNEMQAKQTAQQYKIIALGLDAFMVVWLSFELWMVVAVAVYLYNVYG